MNLTAFVQAVGSDVKALKAQDNELQNSLSQVQSTLTSLSSTSLIADNDTLSNKTWSAQKINDKITQAVNAAKLAVKNDIVNGAGSALDTLKELSVALGNDPNYAANVASALAKRVSVEEQTLTPTQKAQVLTNLGLPSDLLAIYNAAKA